MIADNLTAEQYQALLPFIEVAKDLKPLFDSYPAESNMGPPFPAAEWKALLVAFGE